MRALFTFLIVLIHFSIVDAQSIIVNPTNKPESNLNAEDLTREVLISGGACSDISNFQLKDNPSAQFPNVNRSWGYFEKGNSAFPFEKGIVLTSGYAKKAEGPKSGTVSDGEYAWTGDSQANVLAGGSTNNATVFEFDFTPYGNEIAFNYIFASEEYPTFACSSYNDVFGFIISGPGITNDPGLNGKNIALLPNGQPVTINNVNNQQCGDATYYVHGPFPYIQYGGRTTTLTAQSTVIPGETYHIRLIIADTGDVSYDSAVFLEAGSFNLGSTLINEEGIELDENEVLCDLTEFKLIANVSIPNAIFQWSFNGVPIPGATSNQYTATQTGNYSVEIISAECSVEVDVDLVFSVSPDAIPYETSHCSASGTYNYNLTDFNTNLSTTPGATFTYYNTNIGALTQNPADLITNFTNFPVTGTVIVFVRVENADGCFKVVPLTLEVGVGPETQPINYPECEVNGTGVAVFDLTSQNNNLVVTNPAGLTFEYFLDAGATQPIADPTNFTNTSNPQIIYVKVFDPALGDEACESLEQLTLIVNEFPEIQADELTICDNLNDNSEFVDLTINDIVVGTGFTGTYTYFTQAGAQINNPTNYEVTTSPTVITVLIKNSDGTCDGSETLTIHFNPAPDSQNANLEKCSSTGFSNFHLPDANTQILANTTGINFSYYLSFNAAVAGDPANALPEDFTNTENNQIIFVRVEDGNGCYNVAELVLEVNYGPDTVPFTAPICDDNGDGFQVFNLEDLAANLLVGPPNNIEIGYFLDPEATQPIANPQAFTNTINPQIVYLSFLDTTAGENACISIGQLTLEVTEFPEIQAAQITTCDNLHDGTEIVDLTQNDIVVTQGMGASLHYFTEIGGAEITNPQTYEVTTNPTTIFVLVRNTAGTCEDYQTLTINLQESPDATDEIVSLENCSLTDFTQFFLPDANDQLVANITGLNFSYHLTYDEAFNGTNPLPNTFQNTVANQIVFARIKNANGCFDIGRIQLTAVLVHEEIQTGLEVCDDPYQNNDGIASFDLTQMHEAVEIILGGTNYDLTYHTSLEDAVSGASPIATPTNFQNTENPQTIYVQASSGQGGCAGVAEFRVNVLPVPEFQMKNTIAFCDYDFSKPFEFLGDFESYTWYGPNGNVISTNATIEFTEPGTHTLEVTEAGVACPARRDIEVIFDSAPIITNIEVNGSTVTVSANGGYAPYNYSYTNGLIWENNYIMHNVPSGIHDMIVKSKYGCISKGKMFGVLGIPNFISPNGDGINDYFSVRGLEAYPNSHIKIFDRYGKIFLDRKLTTGFKWDGTYMGRPVASGDYWYIITIEEGKSITGHISVRNQ